MFQSVYPIEYSMQPTAPGCLQELAAPATTEHMPTRVAEFLVVTDNTTRIVLEPTRVRCNLEFTRTQKLDVRVCPDGMSRCLRSRSTSELRQIIVRTRGCCVHCVTVQKLKHNLTDRHDRSRFAPSWWCS